MMVHVGGSIGDASSPYTLFELIIGFIITCHIKCKKGIGALVSQVKTDVIPAAFIITSKKEHVLDTS